MRITEALVLVGAGTLGGVFSTVVSIASLVSYPVLLALGLPPLSANMTNTVSLVLTGAGSVAGSRPELTGQGGRVARFGTVTALGGICGAALLLLAPASTFTLVAPALIGGASIVLLIQPRLRLLAPGARPGEAAAGDAVTAGDAVNTPGTGRSGSGRSRSGRSRSGWPQRAALFCVAVYVGYFGAAAGVMLLVVLGTMIKEPLVKVNAVKNAVSGAANLMASLCFAVFGAVRWAFAGPLAAGFLIGGWVGPKIARRVPAGVLRAVVSLCGVGLAIRLGFSAYQ